MIKYFFTTIIVFFYLSFDLSNANASSLRESLQTTLNKNSDIKLEKSRLNQVKATKGDAIIWLFTRH